MAMHNVGRMDAAIRMLIGCGLIAIAIGLNLGPFVELGMGALAVLVFGTGLVRSCPLYVLFGINTCRLQTR